MAGGAVTQADLNAAADLIEAYWCGADASMMRLAKDIRNGHSQGVFPRAFARHRQQAEASFKAREDALVEALGALATELDYLNYAASQDDGPALIAARALLARAHTSTDAGGE